MPTRFRGLASLPRSAEAWELGVLPAPDNAGDANGTHLVLVAAPDCKLRALVHTEHAPTHKQLFEAVHTAMTKPGDKLTVARPGRLRVHDPALARVLGTPLSACGVQVQVAEPLPLLLATLQKIHTLLMQGGWGTATGVAPALERALCQQAARIARHKPWDRLLDRDAFLLHLDKGPWPAPVAAVLGAAREVFGIALYKDFPTWARHQALAQLQVPNANEGMDAMLVALDRGDDVPPEMRAAFVQADLPITNDWQPVLTRVHPGREPVAIRDEDETALLTDCLHGLADLFDRHLAQMPERHVEGKTVTARGTVVRVESVFGHDEANPLSNNLGKRPAQHIVGSMSRYYLKHEIGLDLPGPPPQVDDAPVYLIRANKADAVALKQELAAVDGLGFHLTQLGVARIRVIAGMAGKTILGELIHRESGQFDQQFLSQAKLFGDRAAFIILSGGTGRPLGAMPRKNVVEARIVRVVELP